MAQTIIVAVIVLAAVAWLVWSLVRQARGGACDSCARAGSCPFSSRGGCPPEESPADDTAAGADEGQSPHT